MASMVYFPYCSVSFIDVYKRQVVHLGSVGIDFQGMAEEVEKMCIRDSIQRVRNSSLVESPRMDNNRV